MRDGLRTLMRQTTEKEREIMITNVPNDLVERIAYDVRTSRESTAVMTIHVPYSEDNETVATAVRVQVLNVWHDGERMLASVHVQGSFSDPVSVDASLLRGWSILPEVD